MGIGAGEGAAATQIRAKRGEKFRQNGGKFGQKEDLDLGS